MPLYPFEELGFYLESVRLSPHPTLPHKGGGGHHQIQRLGRAGPHIAAIDANVGADYRGANARFALAAHWGVGDYARLRDDDDTPQIYPFRSSLVVLAVDCKARERIAWS